MNMYELLKAPSRPWTVEDAEILWEAMQRINDLELNDFEDSNDIMIEEIYNILDKTISKINKLHALRNNKEGSNES